VKLASQGAKGWVSVLPSYDICCMRRFLHLNCLSILFFQIAICRFTSERGPTRAIDASLQGLLVINGKRPEVSLIEEAVLVSERPRRKPLGVSDPVVSSLPIPKPNRTRRKSHQRNTVQIGTLISETELFFRMVNDPAAESPASFRPSVWEKMTDPGNDHVASVVRQD